MLNELGAGDVPVITVYNKIDLTGRGCASEPNEAGYHTRIWLSAHTGEGLDLLVHAIQEHISWLNRQYVFHIPPQAAEVRAFLYRSANVIDEECARDGVWVIRAEISDTEIGRLQGFKQFGVCSVSAENDQTMRVAL